MTRLPELIVFFSSFSLLLLELTAARLVARHIGSSLETWSAVIGLLLGGIALGNALGGLLADKGKPERTCFLALFAGALFCGCVLPLTRVAGVWTGLPLPWAVQVILVTGTVLLLPALVLGTVSPIATRLSLSMGRPVGRTMGNMYAWSALGSILGTYLTGFVFFSHFRIEQVVWVTCGVLATISLIVLVTGLGRKASDAPKEKTT